MADKVCLGYFNGPVQFVLVMSSLFSRIDNRAKLSSLSIICSLGQARQVYLYLDK